MINRKDDVDIARQRIVNDRIAFSKANLQNVNFIVDSESLSIEQLSANIYELYQNYLRKLKWKHYLK